MQARQCPQIIISYLYFFFLSIRYGQISFIKFYNDNNMQLSKRSPQRLPNKSISPRRSSPLTKSPSSQKVLRSSATKPADPNHPISNKMIASRQALAQTLDTYTLLIRSKNPIRCLEHNTSISLYCQTEQKLLCANCIFGRLQHKFHRVTPIDRSYQKIEKDIDTMNRLINREIDSMRKTNDKLIESLVQEENDAHDCLTGLVEIYQECHRRLEEGFLTAKSRIIEKIDNIRIRYERMICELKLNLQNYGAGSVLRPVSKEFFKIQEILLYEHAVCSAIASQRKFEWSQWVDGRRQVSSVGAQEKRKIISVRDAIIKVTNPNANKK